MPDELLDLMRDRILFESEHNKIHLFANDEKLDFKMVYFNGISEKISNI